MLAVLNQNCNIDLNYFLLYNYVSYSIRDCTMKLIKSFLLLGSCIFTMNAAASEAAVDVDSILSQCATKDHTPILKKIFKHESKFQPLAINVNSDSVSLKRPAKNLDEAMKITDWLALSGLSFDVGLGQVNSENLKRLGYTGERRRKAFDPCENTKLSETIYTDCLERGGKQSAALSCYNTGNFTSGFANGYVAKVLNQDVSGDLADFIEIKKSKKEKPQPEAHRSRPDDEVKNSDDGSEETHKPKKREGDVFDTNGEDNIFTCRPNEKGCSSDDDGVDEKEEIDE